MSDICFRISGCRADYLRRGKVQRLQQSPAARVPIRFAKAPRGYAVKKRLIQLLECGTAYKEDVEVDVAIVGAGIFAASCHMTYMLFSISSEQQRRAGACRSDWLVYRLFFAQRYRAECSSD